MNSIQEESLKKNLQRLRRKDPAIANKVAGASDDQCEILVGRRGSATVVHQGIQLGSAYDPKKEGETIAARITEAKPDIVIAIGFGLGYQIDAIRAKCAAHVIVYEPSAVRLRAALAATPAMMFLADPHFEIASTPARLYRLVADQYTPGLRVQVDVNAAMGRLAPAEVREAVAQISRAKDFTDISVGTRVRDLETWGAVTMQNAGLIMKNPSFKELIDRFPGRPAVVVSAGPSLDKQLPLLAEYRDRLLVICIGQALGALRSVGIEPDLVHILESQNVAHQLTRVGTSDDLNLVVTNDVTPALFDAPVRCRFVTTPVADTVGRWIAGVLGREGWSFGGSTVAHGAVSLAAAMGANPIMLLGQDLAYTDGRHYADGSAYDKVKVTIDDDGYSTVDSSSRAEMLGFGKNRPLKRNRVVWVDGWNEDKVATSPAYAGFIDGYRELAMICRMRGSDIINCTEGGAFIPELEHIPFAEALTQYTGETLDAQSVIVKCHDDWVSQDPSVFRDSIAKVRKLLAELDTRAKTSAEKCRAVRMELIRIRSPQRQIDLLRQVGKMEKKIRSMLSQIPWIDTVVQPEITESLVDIRKGENLLATPEKAVKEAEFLFEATRTGVERATDLLDFCADSVAGRRWTREEQKAAEEQAKKHAMGKAPRQNLGTTPANLINNSF